MSTATVHIESVGGFAGVSRCFKLDPPFQGSDYVTVWLTPSYGPHIGPEVHLVPAGETGACSEQSLKRRPGSFVLHDEPDTAEKVDGAFAFALLMLGGYQITPAS